MALSRVQATAAPHIASGATINRTFSTPPTLGNAIVFAVATNTTPVSSVTDNYGNTYVLAKSDATGGGAQHISIWYCSTIVATGASFTVTSSLGISRFHFARAIEISGVGTGLAVDQAVSRNSAASTTPSTTVTAALAVADAFLVALYGAQTTVNTITVESVSPTWTEEAAELASAGIRGEIDSRVVTGVAGTTQSCSWTVSSAGGYAAALVAFASTGGESRVSQAVLELLSQPVLPAAVVTQSVVELLSSTTAAALTESRVTQAAVELLSVNTPPPPEARLTQALVELLGAAQAAEPARLTQLAVDVLARVPVSTALTQLAVEALVPVTIPARLTQAAVELYRRDPATLHMTQILVELFVRVPPCIAADFPIDIIPDDE